MQRYTWHRALLSSYCGRRRPLADSSSSPLPLRPFANPTQLHDLSESYCATRFSEFKPGRTRGHITLTRNWRPLNTTIFSAYFFSDLRGFWSGSIRRLNCQREMGSCQVCSLYNKTRKTCWCVYVRFFPTTQSFKRPQNTWLHFQRKKTHSYTNVTPSRCRQHCDKQVSPGASLR